MRDRERPKSQAKQNNNNNEKKEEEERRATVSKYVEQCKMTVILILDYIKQRITPSHANQSRRKNLFILFVR